MNFDQKIQLVNTIGIWLAAFATTAAVIVSIWLAKQTGEIKLKIVAGIRILSSDTSIQYLMVIFTNCGERNVTIDHIGWFIGKKKNRSHCIVPHWSPRGSALPCVLAYGETANFVIELSVTDWINDFKSGFCSGHNIETLRLTVGTSTGSMVKIKPEENLLKLLG